MVEIAAAMITEFTDQTNFTDQVTKELSQLAKYFSFYCLILVEYQQRKDLDYYWVLLAHVDLYHPPEFYAEVLPLFEICLDSKIQVRSQQKYVLFVLQHLHGNCQLSDLLD